MLRTRLDEISKVFGPYVTEAETPVIEHDPAEVAFLAAISMQMRFLKGMVYEASASASLKVVGVRRPLIDPASEQFEFVVPFIVTFEGQAVPEEWMKAEKDFARQVQSALSAVAEVHFTEPRLKLVRRKKSDPYKDDPRSLMLLRFRLS